jgi:hypothetical protein
MLKALELMVNAEGDVAGRFHRVPSALPKFGATARMNISSR